MSVNWWQSLLIALVPAIITAFISWLISYTQIKSTKKELKEKYENEKKLYINKARFDTEFSIYKELSEKVVTMVMDVMELFPIKLVSNYERTNKEYQIKIYNKSAQSCTEAITSINKYACFIPKIWYEKFVNLRRKCSQQLSSFYFYRLQTAEDNQATAECYKYTKEISQDIDALIDELRIYINSIAEEVKYNAD